MWYAFLLLVFALGSVQAALIQNGSFEDATAVGPVPLFAASQTGPQAMTDYTKHSYCRDTSQLRIVDRPTRNGNFAARLFLDDGYPSRLQSDIDRDKERCSINMRPTDTGGQYDKDRWYAWSTLLPTENQFEAGDSYVPNITVPAQWWMTHHQLIYTAADGFGKAAIHIIPRPQYNEWKVEVWGGVEGSQTRKDFFFGPLTKGVWHDFLLKTHFHHVDGQALTYLRHRTTNPTTGVSSAWSTVINDTRANIRYAGLPLSQYVMDWDSGVYRGESVQGRQTIYFDGPWYGEAEADVIGFFDAEATQTQLATPATLAWSGTAPPGTLSWGVVANAGSYTVQQCWDARACTESTVETASATAQEPWGKSLVWRVRANPANAATHSASEFAELTSAQSYPRPPTNVTMLETSISASTLTDGVTINLATEGALDWVHWGLDAVDSVNRKSGATTQIGALQVIGPAVGRLQVPTSPAWPLRSWTGGTPTATTTATRYALAPSFTDAVQGTGFSLSAPASSTARTLHLYVGVVKTIGLVTATINGQVITANVGADATTTYHDIAVTYSGSGLLDLSIIKNTATTSSRIWLLGAALE